jgi:phosphoglycerate dehydrogenase-like enzyme
LGGSHLKERLRVVYLTEPHIVARYVIEAVGTRHDLTLFDGTAPLEPQFATADAVIDSGGSVGTRAMLDAAPKVRLWQIMGSGFEHFDLEYWRARGVAVANCPGTASAPALAERALMFALMLTQKYGEARANVHRGVAYLPAGTELAGKLLGLVGFGASAMAFGRLARACGMRLAAVDVRHISDAEAAEHGLEWRGSDTDLEQLIEIADVLSLHVHLNAATRAMIDDRRLRLLKPGAFLINVARGGLVDEAALVSALQEHRLAGAGLDVMTSEPLDPASPLLQMENVVITPHTAGNTDETVRRRAEFCAHNFDRVASGLAPECRLV